MNKATISKLLLLVLFTATACSREQAAEETPDEPVVEETGPAAEDATPDEQSTGGEDEEALQVVEESAAEAEEDAGDKLLLARADTGEAGGSYRYEEGTHYVRLVPSQPTIGGGDKIEVAEFFWYGCPHCFDLEPTINKWAENVPASVRFVRVPAIWNNATSLHGQLFYTQEVLGRNGVLKDPEAFHQTVFEEYHRRGNRLMNENAIQSLFARYDVGAEDFEKAWGSFEVAQKMRVAQDLGRRYGVASVPMVIVNGKYRTSASETGSYPKLLEAIDELIDREGAD